MPSTLRLLILEDRPADAELMLHELRRAGFAADWQRVETEADYVAALHPSLDLILADYSLPQFNAPEALRLLQERGFDIPFIVVTGSISEEVAVECMKQGAADYLLKDRLTRLGPAVTHALDQKRLRAENRRAAEALRESEARFRVIFEHANDAIHVSNAADEILEVNPRMCVLMDYTRDELLRMHVADLQAPEVRGLPGQVIASELAEHGSTVFESLNLHRSGRRTPVEISVARMKSEAGDLYVSIVRDITERKQAEEALRESEERYRLLVDTLPDGVIVHSQGRIVFSNPASAAIMGVVNPADLAGKSVIEFVHPDYRELALKRIQQSLSQGTLVPLAEERFVQLDGTPIDVEVAAIPMVYAGKPAMLTVFNDITERKQAEEALRASEQKYRRLHESMIDGFCYVDMAGHILDSNPSYQQMLGYTFEELTRLTYLDLTPEKWHAAEQSIVNEQVLPRGYSDTYQKEYRRKDGIIFPIEIRTFLIKNEAGENEGMWAIVRDITERKQAEDALAQERLLLRTVIDNLPDAVYAKDRQGRKILVNLADLDQIGKPENAVLGKTDAEIFPPQIAAQFEADDQSVLQTGQAVLNREELLINEQGGQLWQLTSKLPLKDAAGHIVGLVGIGHNITVRKQAEQALRENERRLSTLMSNLPGMAYRCKNDPDWTMEFVSEGCLALTGYESSRLINSQYISYAQLIHPADREMVWNRVQAGVQAQQPYHMEYRIQSAGGLVKWVWEQGEAIYTDTGEISALEGFISDVTERQQAEQALRESESSLQGILQSTADGILAVNSTGQLLFANERFGELWMIPPEIMATKNDGVILQGVLDQLIEPQAFLQKVQALYSSPADSLDILNFKDGRVFERVSHPLLQGAELRGRVWSFRDITAREQAEEALYEQQQVFRTLVENSPDIIARYDRDCQRTYVNPVYLKVAQIPRQELLATAPLQRSPLPAASAVILQNLLRKVLDGGVAEAVDVIWRKADNIDYWYNVYASPEFDREGRVVSVMTISRDITERKQAEQEHLTHLRFFENMDKVSRAIQGTPDLEQMMSDVLEIVLSLFECDRSWLLYPCDPDAPSFRVSMEITRPEYPGAKILNVDVPMSPGEAQNMREALESDVPVTYVAGTDRPISTAQQFGVQSQMFVPIYPKMGKPWVFGMHQCSYPRVWTQEERRLFQEIGRRITDGLTSLLAYRDLRESAAILKEAQRVGRLGSWDWDIQTDTITWSEEYYRIYGFDPQQRPPGYVEHLKAYTPESAARLDAAVKINLQTGEPYELDLELARPDGPSRWITARSETRRDKNGRIVGLRGTAQDITERKRMESLLRDQVAALQTLAEIDREITAATESQTILDLVCRRAAELVKVPLSVIVTRNAAAEIEMTASYGLRDAARVNAEFTRTRQMGLMNPNVFKTRQTRVLNEITDVSFMSDTFNHEGIRALVIVPFVVGQETEGALIVFDTAPREWSADDLQILGLLAGQTAIALEKMRLFEANRARAAQLAMLNEIGQAITSSLDLDLLLVTLLEKVRRATMSEASSVALIDKKSGDLVFRQAVGGTAHAVIGLRLQTGEGIAGWVAQHRQSLKLDDAALDARHHVLHNTAGPDGTRFVTRSLVCVPLMVRDTVTGVLELVNSQRGHFSQDDVQLLESVAAQAAIVIENARLFETEHIARARLETLYRIGQAINSTLDAGTILDRLTDEAVQATQATHGSALVAHPGLGVFERVSLRGYSPEQAEAARRDVLQLDRGLNGRAYRLQQLVYIDDVTTDPDYHPLIPTTRAELAVPIVRGGQVIGNLDLQSPNVNAFHAIDLPYLQALTDQVAIALENARLFEETRRHMDELTIVSQVALVGAAGRPFDETVARATDALSRLWPEAALGFLFVDETGLALRRHMAYVNSVPECDPLESVSFDRGLTGWAAREQRPIRVGDVRTDPHYTATVANTRSEMVAPLVVGAKVIGVVNVEMPLIDAFSGDDLRLLTTLAGQLAVIFEKARLDAVSIEHAALLEQRVQERTAEIRREQARTQAILDALGEGVVVTDLHGTIQYVNQALELLTGFSVDESLGQNPRLWQSGQTPLDVYQAMWATVLGGQTWHGEIVNRRKDGELYFASLAAAPIPTTNSDEPFAGIVGIQRDITERIQAETALRESEALYHSLVEVMPQSLCRKDLAGHFTFANHQFLAEIKWSLAELVGKTDFDIHPRLLAEKYRRDDQQVISTGQILEIVEERAVTDGNLQYIQTVKAPILNSAGDVSGVQITFWDVSDRTRAEEEMRRALEKERELNKLKSNFVSLTSHEFRTPLTTILSSAEMLEHYSARWTDERKQEHLQRIQTSVKYMTGLLNDVLVIAKAEADRLEFVAAPLDLLKFCRDLVEEIQLMDKAQHTLIFDGKADCAEVSMDEQLLRHILSNLLSNALKYSPAGGSVQFDLACQAGQALFRIQDHGLGIPLEDQARLFETFHRAGNVRNIAGTGLGLTIVKRSVDAHGGTIDIVSQVGVGTTVTVKLPSGTPESG